MPHEYSKGQNRCCIQETFKLCLLHSYCKFGPFVHCAWQLAMWNTLKDACYNHGYYYITSCCVTLFFIVLCALHYIVQCIIIIRLCTLYSRVGVCRSLVVTTFARPSDCKVRGSNPVQGRKRDFCFMHTLAPPLGPQHRVPEPVPSLETHRKVSKWRVDRWVQIHQS